MFGQVVFDDPKGFGAHAVEFGQFRAWDARELTQGCVARVVQGAGRRCADLGQLIEGCRHAERLGQRFRHGPATAALIPGFSRMPSAEDTELVAFGVRHDNPRLVALANVDTLRAMSLKASHLGVLVIRPEVEMQPALGLLGLIKPDEVQPRQAIRFRADLELLIRGVDHHPAKSRSPPLPQGHRIHRVNNHLFPFQGHPPSLGVGGNCNHRPCDGSGPLPEASGEGAVTCGGSGI